MPKLTCPNCASDHRFRAWVKIYAQADLDGEGRFEEIADEPDRAPVRGQLARGDSGGLARDVVCQACEAELGDATFSAARVLLLAPPPLDPIDRLEAVGAAGDLVLAVRFGDSVTFRDGSYPESDEAAEIVHWVAEEFEEEDGLFEGVVRKAVELGARIDYAPDAAARAKPNHATERRTR